MINKFDVIVYITARKRTRTLDLENSQDRIDDPWIGGWLIERSKERREIVQLVKWRVPNARVDVGQGDREKEMTT